MNYFYHLLVILTMMPCSFICSKKRGSRLEYNQKVWMRACSFIRNTRVNTLKVFKKTTIKILRGIAISCSKGWALAQDTAKTFFNFFALTDFMVHLRYLFENGKIPLNFCFTRKPRIAF